MTTVNIIDTESAQTIPITQQRRYEYSETLTWTEWITVRRVRLGWTKAKLSEMCGVSRSWLWRGIECPASDARFLVLSDEVRARVELALETEESSRAGAAA